MCVCVGVCEDMYVRMCMCVCVRLQDEQVPAQHDGRQSRAPGEGYFRAASPVLRARHGERLEDADAPLDLFRESGSVSAAPMRIDVEEGPDAYLVTAEGTPREQRKDGEGRRKVRKRKRE